MGFFSAIKKFLGSDTKEEVTKEVTKEDAVQGHESAAQESTVAEPLKDATDLDCEATPHTAASSHDESIESPTALSLTAPPLEVEEAEEAKEVESSEEAKHIATIQENIAPDTLSSAVVKQEESVPTESFSSEDMSQENMKQEEILAQETFSHVEEEAPLPSPAMEQVQAEARAKEPDEQEEQAQALPETLPETLPDLSPEAHIEEEPVQDYPAEVSKEAEVIPSQESVPQGAKSTPSYSGLNTEDQAALSLALRNSEPRLSSWLAVITEDIKTVSPLLWQRLLFLLESLEAKQSEAEAFVQDFQAWLTRMEYEYVEEFRSELQYRLALALDLEDEEDERNRLFVKLSNGLARTREQFTRKLDALFASHGAFDAAFWEEMEELLIMADVGFESSMQLIERLKEGVRKRGLTDPQELRAVLQDELMDIFQMPKRITSFNAPEVIMMIGVNGVGKTTTIAKLAHRDRMQGKKVLIAAADTFRAAATEQLGVWATRVGADFHRKEAGADPAAVAYEAMDMALRGGYDVLYVDTAGRLQTKVNLMEELTKIRNVVAKKHAGAPHRSILVVDATTGQNALSQTKLFNEAAGVDEIILSKLDGTAKGGVAISVALQFQIPITYVGLGEKLEDLRPFNGKDFALALLGISEETE